MLYSMSNEIIPVRANGLEHTQDEIFSAYTHPRLEDFIQKVIDANRESLPTEGSQKLVREFFLYGFMKATGQKFDFSRGRDYTEGKWMEPGVFGTNNGVLAVADFDCSLWIRGGESYHGYFPDGSLPEGVEGTLIESGYKPRTPRVSHSNGEAFADPQREKLFRALHYFSREVRNLRCELTSGLIIKDLSEPEPSAPYKRRDSKLPRIVLHDTILIPGNREKTIEVYR